MNSYEYDSKQSRVFTLICFDLLWPIVFCNNDLAALRHMSSISLDRSFWGRIGISEIFSFSGFSSVFAYPKVKLCATVFFFIMPCLNSNDCFHLSVFRSIVSTEVSFPCSWIIRVISKITRYMVNYMYTFVFEPFHDLLYHYLMFMMILFKNIQMFRSLW